MPGRRTATKGMLLVVATLIGCAGPDPEGRPEPTYIPLLFLWKPGTQIVVTTTRTRTQRSPETYVRSATTHVQLSVEADGDGLRILHRGQSVRLGEEFTSIGSIATSAAFPQVASLTPDFRISRAGRFDRILDGPGFRSTVQRVLDAHLPRSTRPRMRREVLRRISLDRFDARPIQNEWHAIIGSWAGTTRPLGVPKVEVSRDGSAPIP